MTIVFSSCGSGDKHIFKAKLLFKSGFEKGVYLDTPQEDDGWCTFFEWKISGDYRIAAYVYIEDGKPFVGMCMVII